MKLTSHGLDLLDKYNNFLLEHGYTDTDIDGEGTDSQSAINLFIREIDVPQPYVEPDFLCTWDFCDTCIKYRKDHNLPMPELRPHPDKVRATEGKE